MKRAALTVSVMQFNAEAVAAIFNKDAPDDRRGPVEIGSVAYWRKMAVASWELGSRRYRMKFATLPNKR
jgi:hypothetical protein